MATGNVVYLDNAATSRPRPEVCAVMMRELQENYGNPSSLHELGKRAKAVLEESRRTIAGWLNA